MSSISGDGISVQFVGDVNGWRGMREEWNALAGGSPSASFYSRWEWQHAWWRAFGSGWSLSIVAVREGGKLRAVFPFCARRQRTGPLEFTVVSLLGHGHCDGLDVMAPEYEPAFAAAAMRRLSELGRPVFEFAAVSRQSLVNLEFCRGLARGRESAVRAPYLALPAGRDGLWRLLGPRARRYYSRGLRMMNESIQSEMLASRNPAAVRELADVIFGLQKGRFGDRLADAVSFGDYRAFILGALEDSAGEGAAVASAWKLGGGVAAAQLCVDHGGKRCFLLSGFDQKHSKIRPGICLHVGAMIDAVEGGMSEYDFMAGGEEYKYMFTKTDRELVSFAAGKNRATLAGYLALERLSTFRRKIRK